LDSASVVRCHRAEYVAETESLRQRSWEDTHEPRQRDSWGPQCVHPAAFSPGSDGGLTLYCPSFRGNSLLRFILPGGSESSTPTINNCDVSARPQTTQPQLHQPHWADGRAKLNSNSPTFTASVNSFASAATLASAAVNGGFNLARTASAFNDPVNPTPSTTMIAAITHLVPRRTRPARGDRGRDVEACAPASCRASRPIAA
jgi:hypothetical protein